MPSSHRESELVIPRFRWMMLDLVTLKGLSFSGTEPAALGSLPSTGKRLAVVELSRQCWDKSFGPTIRLTKITW